MNGPKSKWDFSDQFWAEWLERRNLSRGPSTNYLWYTRAPSWDDKVSSDGFGNMIKAQDGPQIPSFLLTQDGKAIDIFSKAEQTWFPNLKAYLVLNRAALLHEMECANRVHDRTFSTNREHDVYIKNHNGRFIVQVTINTGGYGMEQLAVMPKIGNHRECDLTKVAHRADTNFKIFHEEGFMPLSGYLPTARQRSIRSPELCL